MATNTNTDTPVGLDAAATAVAHTFDSKGLIVERVNLIVGFLNANESLSQNKALAALSTAVESKVDTLLVKTGFKPANLAHYARVARVLDRLGIKYTERVILAVYSTQLNARDVLDDIVTEVASTVPASAPAKRETALFAACSAALGDVKAANKAKAEQVKQDAAEKAAERKAKAERIAAGLEPEDDGESVTVEQVLASAGAAEVAAFVVAQSARPWSPEDARTILAALNGAVDRMIDLSGLTAAEAGLLTVA